MNARIRGVRLSVIERVEEAPVSALFESAGRIQVQIGTDIFPVHAAALPGGEGTLKLLRLYDGQAVLCYPIAEVIDIVRLPDAVQPSDRKSVVSGKSVSVRVDLGGRRIIKKKKTTNEITKN